MYTVNMPKMNHSVKCQSRGLFSSKLISSEHANTHTHTHTCDRLLYTAAKAVGVGKNNENELNE